MFGFLLMMLGFFQIPSRAARLGDIVVLSFVDLFGVNLMVRIEKKENEKRVRYVRIPFVDDARFFFRFRLGPLV